MIATMMAALKLLCFALVTIILVGVHFIVVLLTGSLIVTRIWHRCILLIFQIKVDLHGFDFKERNRTVFIGSHLSYMDIMVLGAFLPVVFVSKDDVQSWPVFGFLAGLQKTVFIRRDRTGVAKARKAILNRLQSGYDVVLFPEGTSTDGSHVKPFKRALVPFDPEIDIQPFAIRVETLNGELVVTQDQRDIYAWGDLELMDHLWILAKNKSVGVSLHILPLMKANDFQSHQALVDAAYAAVDSVASRA